VRALAPADIVIVSGDTLVSPHWDDALVAAGRSSTTVATATPLSDFSPLFGIDRLTGTADGAADASSQNWASRIAAHSARTRPFVPVAGSHATYISRHALNVVGLSHDDWEPQSGLWRGLSEEFSSMGLVNVVADDVFVGSPPHWAQVADSRETPTSQSTRLIDDFASQQDSPLARARRLAGVAAAGFRVVIDAENMHRGLTGTFEAGVKLCLALDAHPAVSEIVWTASEQRADGVRTTLRSLEAAGRVARTRFVSHRDVRGEGEFDIAFRPCQDFAGVEWPLISALARRNVIWSLDLIANHVPAYAASYADYLAQNAAVEQSWRRADAIAVLSEHVRRDLRSFSYAADPSQLFVLPDGAPEPPVDVVRGDARAERDADSDQHSSLTSLFAETRDAGFILVLGTDFPHKNTRWAVRLFSAVADLGWQGHLVFAGPAERLQNAAGFDGELTDPGVTSRIHVLGHVSDEIRDALLARARVVVFPTLSEGWGMIPFEASAAGTAPLATRAGGLGEFTPEGALTLSLADDQGDAQTLLSLLTSEKARERQLRLWREKASGYSWEKSADILVAEFFTTLTRPPRISPAEHRSFPATDPLVPRGTLGQRVRRKITGGN
jgi:glycosyltransferase involved in cell wall biosynthesis